MGLRAGALVKVGEELGPPAPARAAERGLFDGLDPEDGAPSGAD